ncbi:MAG: DUF6503 family protein [Acidobacteriota bacterium]
MSIRNSYLSVVRRPARRRWLGLALATALLPVSSLAEQRDPKAVELAESVVEAMGGQDAWDATRFVRFNFFGFRLHHWDRQTGRHRLEGKSRDGDSYVILHNVNTREGTVVVNGEVMEGEEKDKRLKGAYGAWINDTYWLVMPYKLLDPGVNLAYDGEETIDDTTFDKLKLTFEGVGLTPGDTYWAYINRDTGLMERWAYFLESWEEDREPTHWQWTDWARHGKVMLSPRRYNTAEKNERMLSDLAVLDHLPDSVFESPDPVKVD